MTLAREELALMTVYRMLVHGGIIPEQTQSPPPSHITPPPQVAPNTSPSNSIQLPAPSLPYTETISAVIEIIQKVLDSNELPTNCVSIVRLTGALELLNKMLGK
jgi:hypothetical protein